MNNQKILVIVELIDTRRSNHSFWKIAFTQVNDKYDKTAEAILNQLNYSLFHDKKLNKTPKSLVNAMVMPYMYYLQHPKALPSHSNNLVSWLDLKGFLIKALQEIEIDSNKVIVMEDK